MNPLSPMTEEKQCYEELIKQERALYSTDLFGFARDILGYDQNSEGTQDRWSFIKPENKFILFLAPRGALKSTNISIAYPLQQLTKNRNLRITLVNATFNNASAFLSAIKEHIEKNERFRELYGDYVTERNAPEWSETSIKIQRDKIGLKEPTVTAIGVFGNIISPHNDLIIVDDPVTIEDMWSPSLRDKKLTWFLSLFDVLEPDGQMIVIGTHWHFDDLYKFIEKNHEKRFANWKIIIHKAKIDSTMKGYEDRTSKAYFPLKYPMEKLEQLRKNKGDSLYLAQYFNDTGFLEGRTFKLEWLQEWTELPADLVKIQGVDLAISESDRGCFFVDGTIGYSISTKLFYLIDVYIDKIDFPTQLSTIKSQFLKFMPEEIKIEANAYQLAMPQTLRTDEKFAALKDRIIAITSVRNKIARITTALSPIFQSGTLLIPAEINIHKHEPQELSEPWEEFIREYVNFPNASEKNDVLDALSIAVSGMEEMEESGWESWE